MTRLAPTPAGWPPPDSDAPTARRSVPAAVDREQGVWHLYERRHADTVRLAAFLCGDVHAAEDIAHEAFVRLAQAWDRISDHGRADAYLRSTVINLVRDSHRRRTVAAGSEPHHLRLVGSAEDSAIGRFAHQRVLDAVSALPLRQRACVVLRHWLRMTETEIADAIDLSVGSVRTHLKRGTESLKRALEDQR